MNKLILGTALTLGLLLGASGASFAAQGNSGDGLSRDAGATGNGRTGGMQRGARNSMMGSRMGGMRMMRHQRRPMMRRHYR